MRFSSPIIDQVFQDKNDAFGRQRRIHFEPQSFPIEVVQDVQSTEPATARSSRCHKNRLPERVGVAPRVPLHSILPAPTSQKPLPPPILFGVECWLALPWGKGGQKPQRNGSAIACFHRSQPNSMPRPLRMMDPHFEHRCPRRFQPTHPGHLQAATRNLHPIHSAHIWLCLPDMFKGFPEKYPYCLSLFIPSFAE